MDKREKISTLQGLRTIAYLMVLLGHCSVPYTKNAGGAGVTIFFVLSGFVLVYSYRDKQLPCDLKNSFLFAVNKIRKLYPLHIILLCMMVILEFIEKADCQIDYVALLLNALLLHAWFPDIGIHYSFSGITWYLSVALFLYLIFPVVKKIIDGYSKKYQPIMMLLLTIVLRGIWSYAGVIVLDVSLHNWFQYVFPITRIAEFVIGCNLGYLFIQAKENKWSFYSVSLIESILVGFFLVSWKCMEYITVSNLYWCKYIIIIPAVSVLVYVCSFSKGMISKFLTTSSMVELGNLSGHMYLLHYVILRYMYFLLYKFNLQYISSVMVAMILFCLTFISTKIYIQLYFFLKRRIISIIQHS